MMLNVASFFIFSRRLLLCKQELKKKLKKTKNPEDVEELKDQLTYVVSGPLFFPLLLSSYWLISNRMFLWLCNTSGEVVEV